MVITPLDNSFYVVLFCLASVCWVTNLSCVSGDVVHPKMYPVCVGVGAILNTSLQCQLICYLLGLVVLDFLIGLI